MILGKLSFADFKWWPGFLCLLHWLLIGLFVNRPHSVVSCWQPGSSLPLWCTLQVDSCAPSLRGWLSMGKPPSQRPRLEVFCILFSFFQPWPSIPFSSSLNSNSLSLSDGRKMKRKGKWGQKWKKKIKGNIGSRRYGACPVGNQLSPLLVFCVLVWIPGCGCGSSHIWISHLLWSKNVWKVLTCSH